MISKILREIEKEYDLENGELDRFLHNPEPEPVEEDYLREQLNRSHKYISELQEINKRLEKKYLTVKEKLVDTIILMDSLVNMLKHLVNPQEVKDGN